MIDADRAIIQTGDDSNQITFLGGRVEAAAVFKNSGRNINMAPGLQDLTQWLLASQGTGGNIDPGLKPLRFQQGKLHQTWLKPMQWKLTVVWAMTRHSV